MTIEIEHIITGLYVVNAILLVLVLRQARLLDIEIEDYDDDIE
jgi:hypothetical protein